MVSWTFNTDANLVGPTQSNFVFNSDVWQAGYPIGYQGNYYRGWMRGPGFWNLDFSLFKEFQTPWFTAEGAKVQLRFEAFDLFNHTNFGNPNMSLTSSQMGYSFTGGASRQIQLGVKFIF